MVRPVLSVARVFINDPKGRWRKKKGAHLAIAHAKDKVAGAVGVGDTVESHLEAVVELQDVAQEERKGDADARHFAKGLVREGHANLADGHLLGGHAGDAANPASPEQGV